jgi:hypothetical protein
LEAIQQRHADFVFEIEDMFADGGLRNMQGSDRAIEASPGGHGTKLAEMSQLHIYQVIANAEQCVRNNL